MTVQNAIEKLGLKVLVLSDGDRPITGGYCGDLLSWVMGRAQSGQAWITIMSNMNVLAVATLSDPSCIILSESVTVSDDILAKAESQGINLLSSPDPSYEVCGKLWKLLN